MGIARHACRAEARRAAAGPHAGPPWTAEADQRSRRPDRTGLAESATDASFPTMRIAAISMVWLALLANGRAASSIDESPPAASGQTIDLVRPEPGTKDAKLQPLKDWLALLPEERHLSVPKMALTSTEAGKVARLVWKTLRKDSRGERRKELDAKVVKAAGREMKFLEREFGEAARGERALFISMHGGGGAPARVNDSQWHNQIRLYAPEEGIWSPRGRRPTPGTCGTRATSTTCSRD